MKKAKKKALIIASVCIVILIGAFIADAILGKSYLKEIKYSTVRNKIENKESFVLLLSQTTCSHCMDFKPKLAKVAKEYELEVYYIEVNLLTEKEREEFKKNFNYSSTPTTVFVKDGEETTSANRINGDVSKEKITSKLKSNGFIN